MQYQYYHTALTIAGSDPSGGAGIQADLKTFSALGCYGMSVITALTAQNTQGVQGILPINDSFICQQLTSIIDEITISAIKIGMLHNTATIALISQQLTKINTIPIVLDPVMVAKGGTALLEKSAMKALITCLFPLATVITPNIPEAELLLGEKITDRISMQNAAKSLGQFGSKAVLLKGGHANTVECSDCLYISGDDNYYWYHYPRIQTRNTHGTGCTLSAAIAAFLARGEELPAAIRLAKEYISGAIEKGSHYYLGPGNGPVAHFFKWW